MTGTALDSPGDAAIVVPLDEAGRVAAALPCRTCGYELRGSAADGACPECAAPVSRSMLGDLLQFADRAWLLRVAQGAGGLGWGSIAQVAIGIGGTIVIQLMVVAGFRLSVGTMSAAVTVIHGLVMILVVGAIWLMTTPDPATRPGPAERLRLLARLTLLPIALQPLITPYWQSAVNPQAGGGGLTFGTVALILASTLIGLVALVGWIALLLYMRQLALRIPDARFARHLVALAWAYAIVTLATSAFGVAMVFVVGTGAGGTGQPSLGFVAFALFGLVMTGFFLVCEGLYIWHVFRLRKRLLVAADEGGR